MFKNLFCTPKLRPATAARNSSRPAMSLLQRLRDAVFRFIMLSAVSKGRPPSSSSSSSASAQPRHDHHYHYYPNDPHHSEAVADCIEFIKKSTNTAASGANREESATAQPLVIVV